MKQRNTTPRSPIYPCIIEVQGQRVSTWVSTEQEARDYAQQGWGVPPDRVKVLREQDLRRRQP
ncbi:MAG: hypothetical protein J2P37_31285 [Ktedonobacteraceae bacterium]|nr:hypothetical protein [Ktedonobacteraceae bacterium]